MEIAVRDGTKSRSKNQTSQEPLKVTPMSDVIMRPLLKGVSTPILCPDLSTQQQQESVITQQIAALVEKRKQLRLSGHGGDISGSRKGRVTSKVISDVQVVPPRPGPGPDLSGNPGPGPGDGLDEWRVGRKAETKKRKISRGQGKQEG